MYTAREVALINLFLTEKTVYVSDDTMNHPRWLNSYWAATFKAMSREGIVTLVPRPEDVRSGRVEIAPTRPSSALTLGFMAEPYNTVDGTISLILGLTEREGK